MFHQQPALRIDTSHQTDAYVICIEGELDLGRCPDLERALGEAERTEAGRIILDIEQLTFIDSTGLGILLTASRRSASNGTRLQITRGKGQVADMFRLTALDRALPLTDPCLCPAIQGSGGSARGNGRVGKGIGAVQAGSRRGGWVPDDANRPRTGEEFMAGPSA